MRCNFIDILHIDQITLRPFPYSNWKLFNEPIIEKLVKVQGLSHPTTRGGERYAKLRWRLASASMLICGGRKEYYSDLVQDTARTEIHQGCLGPAACFLAKQLLLAFEFLAACLARIRYAEAKIMTSPRSM